MSETDKSEKAAQISNYMKKLRNRREQNPEEKRQKIVNIRRKEK